MTSFGRVTLLIVGKKGILNRKMKWSFVLFGKNFSSTWYSCT